MRIFFATDIHGSDVCWKKFINAGEYYRADVLILGGDMTGKAVVPVVQETSGKWTARFLEQDFTFLSREEVMKFQTIVANRGYYAFIVDRAEYDDIVGSPEAKSLINAIYEEKVIERIRGWLEWATEKIQRRPIPVFCCPGNDDFFGIDEVIREYPVITHGEGQIVPLSEGYRLLSMGWTSPTPWNTFREASEEELGQKLETLAQVSGSMDHVICNIHCPPYGSSIDEAPELDENMRPKLAGNSLIPVGSKSVRVFLERYQPLVSLHGHIHEGRGFKRIGKRTMAFNPGSQYEQGVLLGALVDVGGPKGIRQYSLTQG
ncbi:MAG: metallophosphoesterase [Firmicutes bacterium]|nr:metallophosphoesterase [Bacillota bacterium]